MNQFDYTTNLLNHLNNLSENQQFSNWICNGKTDIAYGTPGGSWNGNGYLFELNDGSFKFIIRSLPNKENSYIVIESINLEGQLYNIRLNDHKKYVSSNGKTRLLESYSMTVGYGKRKREEVKNEFLKLGVESNVISEINDVNPDWEKVLLDILKWSIYREKVKIGLKNHEQNSTKDGIISIENEMNTKVNSLKQPINQILYGPPGTGKTYNTINKAIAIINPDFDLSQDRNVVKAEFDRLQKEGQIAFTTFHQSMSYEDFIEGIKPLKPETEDTFVKYDVIPGIFKTICDRAKKIEVTHDAIDWETARYFKMSLGGKNKPDVHEWCIDNNVIALGYGGDKDLTKYKELINWEDFRNKFLKEYPELVLESKYNIQAAYSFLNMKQDDVVVISKGNHIIDAIGIIKSDYYWDDKNPLDYYHYRKVEWIAKDLNTSPERFFRKNISQMTIYEFYTKDIKKEAFIELTNSTGSKKTDKPHVLIIDEINRGNVSQIFGELITLIEDSKRIGKDEALEVILPYSKKSFGVPPNLHIIGTMNTADRSVEALDTALRRRFSFEEMPPRYDLKSLDEVVYSFPLKEILKTINLRIEKLIDKDHAIGHSYFLNKDEDSIVESFYKNIIPLLQEYFFGDYAKMGLVLGKGFVNHKTWDKGVIEFANFDADYANDFEDKTVYEVIDYRFAKNHTIKLKNVDTIMDFEKAIQILMNKKLD